MVREALSGISGSISLASWILVFVPQLTENYKAKNAQGVSLAFLAVWFVGDITNLIGAVWAQLVPTVIALAFYFCLADIILILQCLYYNYLFDRIFHKLPLTENVSADGPQRPLLARQTGDAGLPGTHHYSTSQGQSDIDAEEAVPADDTEGNGWASSWVKNTLYLFCVCAFGAIGWAIAWKIGLWVPVPEQKGNIDAGGHIGAELLGYVSAACYLG
ncbi:MAG: hypothetical protein Q9198_002829 [Flavoplaca austrocitrina]